MYVPIPTKDLEICRRLFVFNDLRWEVPVPTKDLEICRRLFVFNDLRWEVPVPTKDLEIYRRLFVFIDLRWEVIVLFVAIGEIVDHRCLNCLFITLMLSDLFTKNIGNYHLLTNMITRSVKGDISYRFHLLF